MRKSMSTTRSRFIRAGIAAGAVTAALLAATAAPAFATATVTISPATGPAAAAAFTITATSAAGFHATTNTANFSTDSVCPASATANATNVAAPTIVTASTSSLTITVPITLVAPVIYKVCVYASTVLVNSGVTPLYTVTPARPVLSPTSGPTGAPTPITATLTGFLTGVSTPAATFSIAACATTYGTPTANLVGTVSSPTANAVTIAQPAGVVAPNTYNVCIYAGAANASALLAVSSATFTPGPPGATLSPATGLTGGGNPINAASTIPFLSGVAAPGVTFSIAACAGTYTTTTANLVGTNVAKFSDTQVAVTVPPGVVAPNVYNVCFYAGTSPTVSLLVGTSIGGYTAAFPVVALSATTGKIGGGNTLTGIAPSNFLTGISTPGVVFATPGSAACAATYTTSLLTATGTRIALNRLAITVPNVVTGDSPYKVCIYDGTLNGTSTLIAIAPMYTAATATTLVSVSPAAGPALGKSLITVTGTGFSSAPGSIIAASIGGTPLDAITPLNTTTFTAMTPPHIASPNLTLSVTTAAGTFTLKNAFTYTNGIVITPNTAPNEASSVDVYVVGVGFTAINFSATPTDGHIYLVKGVYDASGAGPNKPNGPVAECSGVLVIGDTELICSMQLSQRLGANGALATGATRAITDGVVTGTTTFTSATAKFTSADVGLGVLQTGGGTTGTEIPAGTTIVSVTSPTSAVLSATATPDATPFLVTIGGPRPVTAVTAAPGSATVTGVAGQFVAADVGRPISGTGIAPGTTVAGVATNGSTATLSRAAITAATTGTLTVSAAAQVPDGAYTMTFVTDGSLDAAALNPDYNQSIITSGSTFTVADY
jgi:IPT/TIG domain-containing protein